MGLFEPQHLIIIALVLLLFFGGKKIPELMRGLGKGMKDFKDAQDGSAHPDSAEEKVTQPQTRTDL